MQLARRPYRAALGDAALGDDDALTVLEARTDVARERTLAELVEDLTRAA